MIQQNRMPFISILYMNDGNEVSATIRTFAEKMVHYPAIVSQLEPYQRGVINLEVGSYFKAFEPKGDKPDEKDEEFSEGNESEETSSELNILFWTIVALSFWLYDFLLLYNNIPRETIRETYTSTNTERDMELREELIVNKRKKISHFKKQLNEQQKQLLQIEQELSNETLNDSNLAEEMRNIECTWEK